MAVHLTLTEREVLYRLKLQGLPHNEIAELMGRAPSTISRDS
jgi:IS30 family transposase